LSRQLLVAHEKACEDGYQIPLELVYWDVWRGKDTDRPAFHQLLCDIRDHKQSDVIYIDQTDRLSRDRAVYYVLLHDLTRYGLRVRFGTEEDELIRHIKLVFDELELEKRHYRQVQANRARATKGHIINKFPAFGYNLSVDKTTYIINEDKANWVRQIFDWFLGGKSIKKIVQELYEMGIPSPRGRKLWSPESVRQLLKREVYKGVYIANRHEKVWMWENGKQRQISRTKPEEEWISLPVPAIVSEEQWDLAQELLATNKQKSLRNSAKNEWLLSGLLRCACGKSMITKRGKRRHILASGQKKAYDTEFYVCWEYFERWNPEFCNKGQITKNRIEGYVLEACELLFMKPDLWEEHLDDPSELIERWQSHVDLCEKQIKEIDAQMDQLLQLVLEQRSDKMKDLFTQKQKELEEQRERYEEQLTIAQLRLNASQDTVNQREIIAEMLERIKKLGGIASLPYEVKRTVLTRLIDEITLDIKEQWFEIKGVLSDKLERFEYSTDGQVVSISAR
jgi:site-specific DNA recombinase